MSKIYDISIIIKGSFQVYSNYESTIVPQKDDLIAFDESTYIKVLCRMFTTTDVKRVVVIGEFVTP